MIIKCPSCQYVLANMETFEFMGHKADYWIELQTKAELLDVTNLIQENCQLKAKLYSIGKIVKEMKGLL
jgi:hypothetical protein